MSFITIKTWHCPTVRHAAWAVDLAENHAQLFDVFPVVVDLARALVSPGIVLEPTEEARRVADLLAILADCEVLPGPVRTFLELHTEEEIGRLVVVILAAAKDPAWTERRLKRRQARWVRKGRAPLCVRTFRPHLVPSVLK